MPRIVLNTLKRPLSINDINVQGITIEAKKKFDLMKVATLSQIAKSKDLPTAVKAGMLKVFAQSGSEIKNKKQAVGYLAGTVVDESLSSVTSQTSESSQSGGSGETNFAMLFAFGIP